MPYYDYQGKIYEIDSTDPAEARAKIQAYLQAQPSDMAPEERATQTQAGLIATGAAQELVSPDLATQAVKSAGRGAYTLGSIPIQGAKDVAQIAKNLYGVTGTGFKEIIEHPYSTVKAYVAGHPTLGPITQNIGSKIADQSARSLVNQTLDATRQAIGNIPSNIAKAAPVAGRAMAAGLMAPENVLLAPYTMAGYEMERIRQNPTAPEYATNPYAQMTRGEYPTMGAAGAANRRAALQNMPYGNLTAEEQAVLNNQTQPLPVENQPPTAENFIERMKRLALQYGPVALR